jgi:hypothetical protein
VRNGEQRADGTSWGEDPVRTAYAAATVLLFAALASLNALRDAVNVPSTSYVPGVLSRAATEAGAQAWWLLEPGIGARRRVIRSVLVRAGSAENLETTVHAVDSTALVSDYGEDPAAILAYATALGLAYAKVKNAYGNKAFESEGERRSRRLRTGRACWRPRGRTRSTRTTSRPAMPNQRFTVRQHATVRVPDADPPLCVLAAFCRDACGFAPDWLICVLGLETGWRSTE